MNQLIAYLRLLVQSKSIFAAFAFILFFSIPVNAQIITTVAGNGTSGYSGDGGPALNAQMGDMFYTYPAFDHAGNMYIAQNFNNTIRRIDPSGIITTIAGRNGIIGNSGEGGPAINALLYHPTAIAVDGDNNIFFADGNGTVIRKIDASGIITSVSLTSATNCAVGDGGLLAQASFRTISALTFDDAGNLYISDYGCNTVRKVNSAGIINTIAGNGSLGFSGDGGPAVSAKLAFPTKVAVDHAGNIYIPDAQNHRIRKVDVGGVITTIAGNGSIGYSGDGGFAVNAQLNFPGSVIIDKAGNLYIGDYSSVIRKVDASGIITTYAGNGRYGYSGDGGPALLASMTLTEGRISIDDNDNIYFVNYPQGNVIRKVSSCLTAGITQQPATVTLCSSGNASFSIAAFGASSFQWQLNIGSGWVNVIDNSFYSGCNSSSLLITAANIAMNNYQYRCAINTECGTIYSAPVRLMVNSQVAPSLAIDAPLTSICEGTAVTFSATPVNAGALSFYQWKKNGLDVGTGNTTYTDNSLKDGDVIFCLMTSSAPCLSTATVKSNQVTVSVQPKLIPSIIINSSANNICAGSPVNFVAAVQNEGANPIYQWKVNGLNLGNNAPSFSTNNLNNGDNVSCTLTSNFGCVSSSNALSNDISMNVKALLTPSVAITTQSSAVCPGVSVTFNAIAINSGTSTVYQWEQNGIAVGGNGNSYTAFNIAQGDVVRCKMTTQGSCLANSVAVSNSIPISLFPPPVVTLDHTAFLCQDEERQLDAGNFSAYMWSNGSTSRTMTMKGIGTYFVNVIDKNGCIGSDTAVIDNIYPSPQNFLPADTAICSYGSLGLRAKAPYKNYRWSTGGVTQGIKIFEPGLYWLEVQDANGCKGKDFIKVNPKDCLTGFYIPTAFTPNRDGKNDVFRPLLFGNVQQFRFTVYNRWGQVVFQTSDLQKGWDGKLPGLTQDGNVFVWTCTYQFKGETEKYEKGTVTLIR